jgi:hypothetical protein
MISIYSPAWNESFLLGHYYRFYRQRFPDASFTIIDNESDDYTAPIATSLGMDIKVFKTDNQYDEYTQMAVRTMCYKHIAKGWVLICDIDEWIDITQDQLWDEIEQGTTVIRTQGYDMCNVDNILDLTRVRHGVKNDDYSKHLMFDASKITDMKWVYGCHRSDPQGDVVYSKNVYNLYHMKYWNPEYLVNRYKSVNERRSDHSKRNDHGIHYAMSEEQIINEYNAIMQKAQVIR